MATSERLLQRAARAFVRVAAVALAAYTVAALARYGLVERDDLGILCQPEGAPWWCALRLLIIRAFVHNVFGLASVALAVLAAWRRSAVMAGLAIALGTVGVVLYGFTWSGVGMLGGALVQARLQGEWQKNAEPERGG